MNDVPALDPSKYHVLSKKQKLTLGIFGAIFLFVIAPAIFCLYYKTAINRPSQTDKEITYVIKKGQDILEISRELYEKNAINSSALFNIYVYTNRLDKSIQAGVYTIPAGTSIKELLQMFQHGTEDISMTFIEGWRVEEFAQYARDRLNSVGYNEFIEAAKEYEGRLFPDTYYVNKSVATKDLVTRLKDTFEEKTKDLLTPENLQKANLTYEQALIFASIVEREMHIQKDRPVVAGILIKRFRENMPLGADATVQYAVTSNQTDVTDWWPKSLSSDDLNIDSPYNTRRYAGLPPAPISSFSASSLNAVLNYQDTDYYYYLTDNNGVTRYAKTLDEHNSNIQNYLD